MLTNRTEGILRPGKLLNKRQAPVVLLILFTLILFSNTFSSPFIWDDEELIFQDPYIKELKYIPVLFTPVYWKHLRPAARGEYRPMGTVFFALDHFLWGVAPYGYHLTNITIYILIILLVYFICHRIIITERLKVFRKGQKSAYQRYMSLPFLTALFFASHPVHVESVTWIKNRTSLLAMMFLLLSLLLFIKHTIKKKTSPLSAEYFSALFFSLMAFISHEIAVSLPLLLLLYSLCFTPLSRIRRTLLELAPFFLLTLFYLLFKIFIIGEMVSMVNRPVQMALLPHVFSVLKTYGQYLWLLIFPVTLKAEYVFRIPDSIFSLSVILPALALTGISYFGISRMRRKPLISFSILWVIIAILPASNIVPLSGRPLAEQRLLVPSLGICIFMAAVLSELFISSGKHRKLLKNSSVFISIFVVLFFSARTVSRAADWNAPLKFWKKTVESTPQSSRAYYNLGISYLGGRSILEKDTRLGKSSDKISKAMSALRESIRLDPSNFDAYNNLGNIYIIKGSPRRAVEMFEKAAEIKPSDSNTFSNLALAYEKRGLYDKAIAAYDTAIHLDPFNAAAFNNLGTLYYDKNMLDKARPLFEKAIRLKPDLANAYTNLGNLYDRSGTPEKALYFYKQALKISPDDLSALLNTGKLMLRMNRPVEALPLLRQAIQTSPANSDTYGYLFAAYDALGKKDAFLDEYMAKAARFPSNPQIQIILAKAFLASGDITQAREHLERTLTLEPDNIQALILMGRIYMEEGEDQKAHEYITGAFSTAPDNPDVLYWMGRVNENEDKVQFAADLYFRSFRAAPRNYEALGRLITILISSGRAEEAMERMLQLKKEHPDSAAVQNGLGSVYMSLQKYSEAVTSFKKSLSLDPGSVMARDNLARALASSGRTGEALKILQEAIIKDPNDAMAFYELANIYNISGSKKNAIELYRKAIKADPSLAGAYNNLGVIYGQLGKLKKAEDMLKKAIDRDPSSLDAYNNLGNAYMASGQKENAIKTYEKLIELDPDYAPAYFNLGNIHNISGNMTKASLFYQKALDKDPDYALAHSNLAVIYYNLGNINKAREHFEKAKALGSVNPRLQRALEMYEKE
jgi:tetratricopeptide (TPR) repeat protein